MIGFGVLVGIAMPFIQICVNNTVERLWTCNEIWADLYDQRFRPPSAVSVSVFQLREKAHATKESYYLDLLKEAKAEEAEHLDKTQQTALFALTVLVLSGVNLYAPLSPEGNGILTQIADGLGQNGYGLLFWLGLILILVVLAFYPVFENYRLWVYCPELAHELEEKRREEQERFRREAEARKASPPPSVSDIGARLGGRFRRTAK